MNFITKTPASLMAIALAATPFAVPAAAQQSQTAVDDRVLTTVTAPRPPAMDTMADGPDIEGFISARNGNRIAVTANDGTRSIITVTEETSIKAKGGFLGLGRETLGPDALLNGLPVEIGTKQWEGGLVANDVRFSDDNLEVAQMVRSGTDQRFTENEAATEELRGRVANIDQYNVKSTTNVYFDTGRSNISGQARAELCRAADQASQTDNALLLVVGYTDSTGSQELNQRLSEKRAGNVVNYLQQQCGWAPYRMLTPTGMSESNPVADNETMSGKAQNRRVAVNVLVSKSVDGFDDSERFSQR